MGSHPQTFKDGQLVGLTRQDGDIGQRYVFSAVKTGDWEHTYQLNNLMEITNRILLNTEEIMKSGPGSGSEISVPGVPGLPGNISYTLMQVKDTVDRIEEIVRGMDETQTKRIFSPETTWDERIQMVLSSIVTGAASMIINEGLKLLGAYFFIKNSLRTALFRIAGNFNFDSPPGIAGPIIHDELR